MNGTFKNFVFSNFLLTPYRNAVGFCKLIFCLENLLASSVNSGISRAGGGLGEGGRIVCE